MQRRTAGDLSTTAVAPLMNPWTIRILIVSIPALAYVGWQLLARAAMVQRIKVQRALYRPFAADDLRTIYFGRDKEEEILAQYFNSPPSGPSVIVGPEGTGKRTLLKKVRGDFQQPDSISPKILAGRRNTVWVELRKNPVTTGEELLRTFISIIGYSLPAESLLSQYLQLRKQTSEYVFDVYTEYCS